MAERERVVTKAEQLRRLYAAKAEAELADADALVGALSPGWSGALLADVVLVLGAPASDANATDGLLGRVAGEAALKAMAALGVEADAITVIASRPTPGASEDTSARRLELAVEAVDPTVVMALDPEAAADLAKAFDIAELVVGRPIRVRGRELGGVGNFAASLADLDAKRRVWSAMRSVAAAAALKAKGRPKAPHKESSNPA